jgi:hypothetical protein
MRDMNVLVIRARLNELVRIASVLRSQRPTRQLDLIEKTEREIDLCRGVLLTLGEL